MKAGETVKLGDLTALHQTFGFENVYNYLQNMDRW